MFKKTVSTILVSLSLVILSMTVSVASAEGPCAKDREAFCKDVQPGEGRIIKCLKDNKDKLSAECKTHHEKMKAHHKEVKEACHEDVEKLCAAVEPGKGRIKKCMLEKKDQLSEGCKSELAELKKLKK